MKTKEEIKKLATQFYRNNGSGGGQYTEGYRDGVLTGFVDGYNKSQEDMSNKKYTEEDMISFAYQFSSINVADFRKHLKDFNTNLEEKNK